VAGSKNCVCTHPRNQLLGALFEDARRAVTLHKCQRGPLLLFAGRCKASAEFDIPSQALDSQKTERSGPGRAKGGPVKV
jgi:hypothetical protein